MFRREVRVPHRHGQAAMAQKLLKLSERSPLQHGPGRERVPEGVEGYVIELRRLDSVLVCGADGAGAEDPPGLPGL